MAKDVKDKVPSFEEVPAKLSKPADKSQADLENALLRLSEAQAELKEARVFLKEAQRARVRALMGSGANRRELMEHEDLYSG